MTGIQFLSSNSSAKEKTLLVYAVPAKELAWWF
jgi:hypothetical protein